MKGTRLRDLKVPFWLNGIWPSISTVYGGPDNSTPYMTRFRWRHHRIHIFHRGDGDPDHHDHPFDFTTFPLTSYVEEVRDTETGDIYKRVVRAFRVHRRQAEFAHRVLGRWSGEKYIESPTHKGQDYPSVTEGKIVTLVWYGNIRRPWGFWCKNSKHRWLYWKDYTSGTHRC